jgi:subtilase family serine protease
VRLPISVVGRSPAPDLVPTSATASTPVTAGGAITLASTIVNSGPGKAAAFYVSFYVSTDAALSGDDVLFAVCDFPLGLAPGASTTCSGTLPFAPVSALAAGSYRVVMFVDSALEVAETDEDNNVLTVAAPVVVQ